MAVPACSKNTLLISSLLWFVVSVVALCASVVVFVNKTLFIIPDNVMLAFVTLFGTWSLVSVAGVSIRCFQIECTLVFFILCTFFSMIVTTFTTGYSLLAVNDIETIGALDTAAGELGQSASDSLIDWIVDRDNNSTWIDTQELFECCGYDFEALFLSQDPNRDIINSGPLCDEKDLQSVVCVGLGNLNGAELEQALNECRASEGERLGLRPDFFCLERLSTFAKEQTLELGLIGAFLVLLQLTAWISALRMYWVPVAEGGFSYRIEMEGKPGTMFQDQRRERLSRFGKSVQTLGDGLSNRISGSFPQRISNRLSNRVSGTSFGFNNLPPVYYGGGGPGLFDKRKREKGKAGGSQFSANHNSFEAPEQTSLQNRYSTDRSSFDEAQSHTSVGQFSENRSSFDRSRPFISRSPPVPPSPPNLLGRNNSNQSGGDY